MKMIDIDAAWLAANPLPAGAEGDKETRGRILVVGGSLETPGGVMLAGLAALRAGAGKLQVATDARVQPHVAVALPEAMVIPLAKDDPARAVLDRMEGCDTVVVGPGMIDSALAGRLAAAVLTRRRAPVVVLDAAAMTDAPARLVRAHGRAILTPHAGEMAKLMGVTKEEVLADPLAIARKAAGIFGAVVVMKGGCTYLAAPDGRVLRHEDGVFGLATSGSGDVLAGIIGGLAARGAEPLAAAAWGVWLHGQGGARLARRIGPLGFLAREILDEIAPAMAGAPRS